MQADLNEIRFALAQLLNFRQAFGMARRRSKSKKPSQTAFDAVSTYPFAAHAIFSEDRVAAIHETALTILENLGVKMTLDEGIEIFKSAGAVVNGDMVHVGRDLVEAALKTVPRGMTIHAPNPRRNLEIKLGNLCFFPGGGCPNVSDRIKGRRQGDLSSYQDAVRLVQHFDVLAKPSPAPEPQDVPVHLRHYAMMETQIGLSDKSFTVYGRGRKQVMECFEILQTSMGFSDVEFRKNPYATTVINTNSPRLFDRPMAQALIDFARMGQMCIVTPFCLAGAMAPITVAGALTLQHAECLAAITLNQLAKPGAPVMYGGFGSNVDMRSGAPAFGTPEHIQMSLGSGQLARHIGMPWRSAVGVAANTNDMQATHETLMSLWGALNAQATVIVHAAGWLEGGLTFGFEKLIQDIEALQTVTHLYKVVDDSAEAIGYDAIAQVKPGGHFFDTDQTMERYSTAFLPPYNADLSNFGTWTANGAKTAEERATEKWQQILRDYKPPQGSTERLDRVLPLTEKFRRAGGAEILE